MRRGASLAGWGLLAGLALVYHPLWLGRVLAGRDAFQLFIPDTSFLLDCARALDWPLWNPWQRLGQPFAATLQSQAFYPSRWVALLTGQAAWSVSVEQVLHAALAATGAWRLARRLGRSRGAAVVAGAAFGLGPLLTHLGIQQNVVSTAAWAGWLAEAAVTLGRRPSGRGAAWLGGLGALAFLAGSPETLLWEASFAAALVLAGPARTRAAAAGWGAVAAGLGLALAGPVLLPAAEFARHSARLGDTADGLHWSAPPVDLLALGWLNADLPRAAYWGPEQNFLPTVFMGSVVMGLALAGAWGGRRRRAVVALASLGLAWSALSLGAFFPVARWALAWPPFSLFRYPAKYLVAAAFAAAVLAAFGVDGLVARAGRRRPGARAVVTVLLGVVGSAVVGWGLLSLGVVRAGGRAGLAWGLFFAAVAVTGWARADGPGRRRKLRRAWVGVVLVELGLAHALFGMPLWRPAQALTRPSVLAAALRPGGGGRLSVQGLGPGDDGQAFVESSRDALVPLRFVEEHLRAVEGYGAPEPRRVDEVFAAGGRAAFDLAGVTHFIRAGAPPFADLTRVETTLPRPALYRSATALPRAFVVHRARVVEDEEAKAALLAGQQTFRDEVLLTGEGAEALEGGTGAERPARVVVDLPRRVEVELEAGREGWLVLTDAWYPGWRATVDGVEVPLVRADFLVRAVRVGPGAHRVVFTYWPRSFQVGLVLWALGVMAAGGLSRRGRTPP